MSMPTSECSDAPNTYTINTNTSSNRTRSTSNTKRNNPNTNCVISDVIELYCHNIILNTEDRAKESHRLHYFLNILGREAVTNNGRILCSVELVGILIKISHVRNYHDDDDDDDTTTNDDTKDDKSNGNEEIVGLPLDEYNQDEWESLLKDLESLRARFVNGELNQDNLSREHFGTTTQTTGTRRRMTKSSSIAGAGAGEGEKRDVSSMDMFHKLFDDIMNFGSFLRALSHVRPFMEKDEDENDEDSILDTSVELIFRDILQQLPNNNNKYKDILQSSIQTKSELRTILTQRTDLSIQRFRRMAEQLLQNWYVTAVPIPYLVQLTYNGKVPPGFGCVDDDGSSSDRITEREEQFESQPLLGEQGAESAEEEAMLCQTQTSRQTPPPHATHSSESEDQPEKEGWHLPIIAIRAETHTTTTDRDEPKTKRVCMLDRFAEAKAQSPCLNPNPNPPPIKGMWATKTGESLSFGDSSEDDDDDDNDDDGVRPSLSEVPIKVKTKRRQKCVDSSVPSKGRRMFTQEEKHAIVLGAEKFGRGKWAVIKEYYKGILGDRTSIQIKDCYRTMQQKNEL